MPVLSPAAALTSTFPSTNQPFHLHTYPSTHTQTSSPSLIPAFQHAFTLASPSTCTHYHLPSPSFFHLHSHPPIPTPQTQLLTQNPYSGTPINTGPLCKPFSFKPPSQLKRELHGFILSQILNPMQLSTRLLLLHLVGLHGGPISHWTTGQTAVGGVIAGDVARAVAAWRWALDEVTSTLGLGQKGVRVWGTRRT